MEENNQNVNVETEERTNEESSVEETTTNEALVDLEVKKPFYLAFMPYEFTIAWDWEIPLFARVGFMHENLQHPFIGQIQANARNRQMRILHLSTEEISEESEDTDVVNLFEFELKPTEEGLDELESIRMAWVQLYLKMISYTNKMDRSTFIPQMKYYRNQEGPLAGYLRTIDELPDTEQKRLILSHLEKLETVKWGIKYNEAEGITDFTYHIKGSVFNEKLESFFLGAWTVMNMHYARDFNDENMDKLLTLVQLGNNFVSETIDEVGREIIAGITKLLANLTMLSLDELLIQQKHALFIQSALLFPNVYPQVSHMLYATEKTADFDLRSMIPDLKPLKENEVVYRSTVILNNGEEFIKKVLLAIES